MFATSLLGEGSKPIATGLLGVGLSIAVLGVALLMERRKRHASERRCLEQSDRADRESANLVQALAARETADAETRAKRAFFENAICESRTPLDGAMAAANSLSTTPLTAQQREYLATLRSSVETQLAMMSDLLDFSKLAEGGIVLEHTPFDLRKAIVEAMEIVSIRAAQRDREIVLDFAPDVPASVSGDPARLKQVLLCLVSNAVKFTPRGHVAVRVTSVPRGNDESRSWIKFTVSDTGVGIAPNVLSGIFDTGVRDCRPAIRNSGGLGLGLAISRHLVALMGGEIGRENEAGCGSVFWFSVPMQIGERPLPPAAGATARVLIVDDLRPAADAMKSLLAAIHMSSEIATDPAEALTRLRAAADAGAPFDVAMVDETIIAARDGEWTETIAMAPEFRGMKWLLLGSARREDEPPALSPPGFSSSIVKPVLHADQVFEGLRGTQPGDPMGKREPDAVNSSYKGLRLLVAEDNGVNRVVAGGMLKKLGCVVEFAENGVEAVRKFRQNGYDLVLMDCEMPEMDGWTATREIRRRDSRTPIVALTANASLEDRNRCLRSGMNDYLGKPLNFAELARVMGRWVT